MSGVAFRCLICQKGGFLITASATLQDFAIKACEISLAQFHEKPVVVNFGGASEVDELLLKLPKLQTAKVVHIHFPQLPELEMQDIYLEPTV